MTTIDLITGILGAGKTTFIRKYAANLLAQGKKIAILENDFGAVNVDRMMLQDLQSDRCKVEMISGCNDPTCHKRRFKTQLIALGMQQFDRVILEPSGIFDMDEFFDTLYESPLDRWFSIGSILTIVDATMDEVLSAQMEYLLASEAACCGKLVLSKRSLLPDCSEAELTDRTLRHLNRSLAAIQCSRQFQPQDLFIKDWDSMTDTDFQELQVAGYRNSSYVKQYDADDIQSHSEVHYFMHIHLPDERIPEILQAMLNDPNCGTIYRIKGALPLKQNCWLSINLTQKKAELQTVSNGQSVLIVIGDQLHRDALDAHLKAENTDPDYVSIWQGADDIQSHSVVHDSMYIHLPDERIPEILQAMLNDPNCGTIYRIKGALPLKQNCWLSINLTQKKAELQTVSNGQSVLIVIGDQLNRAALDAHLKAENTDPDYVSIWMEMDANCTKAMHKGWLESSGQPFLWKSGEICSSPPWQILYRTL